MGAILQQRLGTDRRFHPGEEALLALSIAAGELGSVVERTLHHHALTHARYSVMRIIRGAGDRGASCAEIAQRLLVASPDVTRLVNPLVERGWVERDRSPSDRRVVVHRLTLRGKELLRSLDEPLERVYKSILRALGAEDTARLVKQCEAVIDLVRSGRIAGGYATVPVGRDSNRMTAG